MYSVGIEKENLEIHQKKNGKSLYVRRESSKRHLKFIVYMGDEELKRTRMKTCLSC